MLNNVFKCFSFTFSVWLIVLKVNAFDITIISNVEI